MANTRPLVVWSGNRSAMMPAEVAMGAPAKRPVSTLKAKKDGQLGATAHAMVKSEKAAKVRTVKHLLP